MIRRLLIWAVLALSVVPLVVVESPSLAGASQTDCLSYGYACTPGYTGANASGTWAWKYYGGSWAQTPNGYHNCTLYAAWRLAQNGMGDPGKTWGNAVGWANSIGGGNHTPAVGSIAWWGSEVGGGFGHVAYVEQVSGSSVYIRADNFSYTAGYTDAGWISASSVDLFLHPHDVSPRASVDPFGAFDGVGAPAPGQVSVGGWAVDPSELTTAVTVHVYVGGPAGTPGAEGFSIGAANLSRPDVGAAVPGAGDLHGYAAVVTTSKAGVQQVCTYAINVGPGNNALLGCKQVTIASPDPFGSFDVVGAPSPGRVRVGGWAVDPNALTTPITVHVYVGGPAGTLGAEGFSIGVASVSRPDVGAAVPGAGDLHGYDAVVTTSKVGVQPVCTYAINVGPGNNVQLGCKQVTIAAPVVPAAPPAPWGVAGDASVLVSFSAPASDGGSPVTGYTVTVSPGGATASGSASPLRVSGLSNGTAYRFTVTATNAIGTSVASAPSSPVTPSIRVSIGDASVSEGASGSRSVRFTVSLSSASVSPVTVSYATGGGTATSGTDFLVKSGSVTIPTGAMSMAVLVAVKGDSTVEANEAFTVRLSSPVGATLGRVVGTGTILNDDVSSGLRVGIGNASVVEGASGARTVRLTVSLSSVSATPVSVAYATVGGTASAGSDYTARSGTLTIAAGATSAVVYVAVKADTTVEANESFTVRLSSPVGAVIGRTTGTATILNDD